jgi:hypothetical protein
MRTRRPASSLFGSVAYIIARFLKPRAAHVVTVIFTATAATATAAAPLIPAGVVAIASLVVTIIWAIIVAAAAPVIVAAVGAPACGRRAAPPGPVIIVRAWVSVERAASATVIPALLPVTRTVFTATAAASLARRASAVKVSLVVPVVAIS